MSVASRTVSVAGRELPVWALALAAVAVVGVAVGGFWLLSGDDDPALAAVPAGVDYVGHADVGATREDPAVRNATLAGLRFQERVSFYAGPTFTESFALGTDHGGLDPEAASSVTFFGRTNGSYAARIVEADWAEADVVRAVERAENVSLSERSESGVTLYVSGAGGANATAVAVLEDGRYVVGDATAVRDSLAVGRDEADPLDGPLRRAFESQREGHVRFAYRFRSDRVPDYPFVGDSVRSIEYVSSAYYRNESADGPRIGVAINLTTAEMDDARSVKGILNAGISFVRFESEDQALRAELRRVELAQEGRRVRINYESTPDGLRVLIAGLQRNEPKPQRLEQPAVRGGPGGATARGSGNGGRGWP